MAHGLIDQVVRSKAAKGGDNKRKWDDNKNNSGHQNKRHEVVRAFTAITGEKKGMGMEELGEGHLLLAEEKLTRTLM
ncbi:hypothetical protein Tco_0301703 [Tanacetum coccineum]